MEGLIRSRGEIFDAAWERSESVHYAMLLLTLELFMHIHGLFGNSSLYMLKQDSLLKWSAVQQFYFTASEPPLVFESSADETAHPLQMERPSKTRPEIVELDEERIVGGVGKSAESRSV